MKIPEFKLVKPSDNLRKYLEMDEISHTDLADAYLEISRCTIKLLVDYPLKSIKLKKSYTELLSIMQIIQDKPTTKKDLSSINHDRDTIKYNKGQAVNSVNLCISLILELRRTRIHSILSSIAIGISIFSVVFTFFT